VSAHGSLILISPLQKELEKLSLGEHSQVVWVASVSNLSAATKPKPRRKVFPTLEEEKNFDCVAVLPGLFEQLLDSFLEFS
jgi:hypothetical protein